MAHRLTLYGSRGSGSAAVEMALRRCAVPYDMVRASTWEPDSAVRQLAEVNPLGQIPTLVLADGTVLTESAAILVHLALSHPRSELLPRSPSARAVALRGLVYIAANCYAAISVHDYPERWTTAVAKDARDGVRAAARRQLHRHWALFADQFASPSAGSSAGPLAGRSADRVAAEPADASGGEAFLGGPRPGALDMLGVVVSKWSGTRSHLARSRPGFARLLGRVQAQPDIAPVWRAHWSR